LLEQKDSKRGAKGKQKDSKRNYSPRPNCIIPWSSARIFKRLPTRTRILQQR